jgi:hypothetical protein
MAVLSPSRQEATAVISPPLPQEAVTDAAALSAVRSVSPPRNATAAALQTDRRDVSPLKGAGTAAGYDASPPRPAAADGGAGPPLPAGAAGADLNVLDGEVDLLDRHCHALLADAVRLQATAGTEAERARARSVQDQVQRELSFMHDRRALLVRSRDALLARRW